MLCTGALVQVGAVAVALVIAEQTQTRAEAVEAVQVLAALVHSSSPST